MILKKLFTIAFVLVLIPLLGSGRSVTVLRDGWKFARGHQENAWKPDFDDSKWQDVSIPHDWAIEGPVMADGDGDTGKLPWQGEGWYRKRLELGSMDPGSMDPGSVVYLLFDGVMASPEVYVNGKLAGKWDYGYNSFFIDITGYLQPGSANVLAVHADTRNHESRWYPGAGIYRKVSMIVMSPVHVDIWGTCVTTPEINDREARVKVITSVGVQQSTVQEISIRHIIFDPQGKEVAEVTVPGKAYWGSGNELAAEAVIPAPQLWDPDHPALYRVLTILFRGKEAVDTVETPFGIRTMHFTADSGFQLNGKRVQLRGVNLHHDQGLLGAAFNVRAAERQLEIMKSMGCNAIRTSHNMPAPEFLDLCDRMGFLVFDEAFDKWDRKADIGPATDFAEFAQRNIRNFILRDRNHPSVFIWSVGNEMGDIQNNRDHGFDKLRLMVGLVRLLDPTRPVTMACDDQKSAVLRHFDYYDVHSWNYGQRYHLARQLAPGKSVIISESASTVSTRGFYELPLPETKTDFTNSLQVSSYDLNAPAWAELSDDDFMWQQEETYVAGEFVWTGFDYIGEPTPYNNDWVREHGLKDENASRLSYFGIVDLCGIPKDRYYLYKSCWKPDETTVHILPHWNWAGKEGQMIPVFVYTNGDSAELFLNKKSLGMRAKKPLSENSIERFRLMWSDVPYEPGTLTAVAYKNGKAIGQEEMKTAGDPNRIKLTPDRTVIRADGSDLTYILIEATDKKGNPCPLADNPLELKVSGPGNIAGAGNGNPQSMDGFQSNFVKLFYGKAMVIIRSGKIKGTIEMTVSSPGLTDATAKIKTE